MERNNRGPIRHVSVGTEENDGKPVSIPVTRLTFKPNKSTIQVWERVYPAVA
jgi:hypothetical protein